MCSLESVVVAGEMLISRHLDDLTRGLAVEECRADCAFLFCGEFEVLVQVYPVLVD